MRHGTIAASELAYHPTGSIVASEYLTPDGWQWPPEGEGDTDQPDTAATPREICDAIAGWCTEEMENRGFSDVRGPDGTRYGIVVSARLVPRP